MRVVAGEAKGRRLVAPPGTTVRPTSDRVRESMFGALGSLDAVDGATVLDLFAGSGALGIEALSRGAAHATFVERDRRALDVVRSNLASTGLAPRATVVASESVGWAATRDAAFDLALLDPPYAFDAWDRLLEVLPADLAVVESDRTIQLPNAWERVRERTYGSTVVMIIRRMPPERSVELP